MRKNENGFSAVEALIMLVVVGVLGGAGWYVWQSRNKKTDSSATTQEEKKEDETPAEQPAEEKKADYTTYSVKATGQIKDQGKCKSGEILFQPLYSADPGKAYEYDCKGLVDILQYVHVFFGQGTSSIVGQFSTQPQTGEAVVLANGVKATKYSFAGQRKGHGTSETYPVNFTIYEVTDGKDYFYGLNWSGSGYNANYLTDFNEMALKNWEIK